MKTAKFSSLKVMHGVALTTVVSVAASVLLAATLAAPVNALAADASTDQSTDQPAKPVKSHHKKVARKASGAAKSAAATSDDTAARPETHRRHVSYTMSAHGRHAGLHKVAFAPRSLSNGQVMGLHDTPDALALRSSVAYVVDQNSSEALFDKNSTAVVPIASITKLMTAMVVLDSKLPLTDDITVTDEDRDYEKNTGSRLAVGSVLSREDMLHIALMASENRAAAALSRYFPGGRPAFLAAMNEKAKQLGMNDTHFENSTGLTSLNVSSARDLVKMVNAAYQYPMIREFSTDRSYDVHPGGKRTLAYNSTNALVRNGSWDIGLQKTGFINEAGECLVMQATINGRAVIIVLLDSAGKYSRFADAARVRKWLDNGGDQRITSAAAGGSGT